MAVQEVSKDLPGVRGSVMAKYEPMARHGGPVHAKYLTALKFNLREFVRTHVILTPGARGR